MLGRLQQLGSAALRVPRERVVVPVRAALRSTPPPVPPEGWVERVLADLVAVDVERWRRFNGRIERADEYDGERWAIELSHGIGGQECGDMHCWWRRPRNETVPDLVGTLTVSRNGVGGMDDQIRTVPMRVELFRGRQDLEGVVWMQGGGLLMPSAVYQHRAPVPAREGVAPLRDRDDSPCGVAAATSWVGFPARVTRVRRQVPLELLRGAMVFISDLVEAIQDLDELLITAASPAALANGDQSENLLLRISADGMLEDLSPEYLAANEWNEAGALDLAYVVDEMTLQPDRLTLAGEDWVVVVGGKGLRATLEVLP